MILLQLIEEIEGLKDSQLKQVQKIGSLEKELVRCFAYALFFFFFLVVYDLHPLVLSSKVFKGLFCHHLKNLVLFFNSLLLPSSHTQDE